MRLSFAPAVLGPICLCLCLASCGPSHPAPPLKKPNDELIVGDFTRRGADGKAAIRFARDGTYRFVEDKAKLDKDPPLGAGTWKVSGDQLTLSAQSGLCADGPRDATYKVVVSKVGVRFEKVSDDCERRATMDGQTWWRL